ncbi:MAG: hypothetical protein AAGK98_03765 [Pseudomonadota bacterium]
MADRVLLSCHLLGKVTAEQLYRVHREEISTDRQMRALLLRLSTGEDRLLQRIKPTDIEQPIRSLPYVYLDTWASRRRIEQVFGVPFRRPPEPPSRDWRFLEHDATLSDDIISFELTACALNLPFGHQTHFDAEGAPLFPKVMVTDGQHTHTLRPRPDKTLIVGGYHLVHEHDQGEEQVSLGHIIRDNTIARKALVYEAVEASGKLDQLGWGPRLYTFIVNGKKRTRASSRKRIQTMIETLPREVNPARFYFIDRQTHQAAGDDVSAVSWLRGDNRAMQLPVW